MHEGRVTDLGTNLPCPPCNVGPLSTPNYAALADRGHHQRRETASSRSPASGRRASTSTSALMFDLGNLRPFQGDHTGWSATGLPAMAPGVNSTARVNVHSVGSPGTDLAADCRVATGGREHRASSVSGRPRAGRR